MPLLGFVGSVLWGAWAKERLINSNQKSSVLISSMGILTKGVHTGKALEGGGETVHPKGCWWGCGGVTSGAYICL